MFVYNSMSLRPLSIFFFFNDTATTEIYTLSLHDALPISPVSPSRTDAIPGGSSVAGVTWVDNATNEAGFRVQRSRDGGASWVVAGTTGIDEIWFYDVDQVSEQPLCYRVIAFNSHGDSPPSNTDC